MLPRTDRMRLYRLMAWMMAMAISTGIAGVYASRKAVFVPCFFLCIMVPAVLLPLHPKPKG